MALLKTLFNATLATITLYFLQPLMNVVRLDLLATNPEGLVLNFVLMLLLPIIWLIFIFAVILEIKKGVSDTSNGF